jgi:GT2 family glycosyltransferase
MKKNVELEIIIVSFNSQFWLKKTLSTLQEKFLSKTKLQVQTTVVDNGSTDNSLTILSKEFPWTTVIPLTENKGFAVANNTAIARSNAEYILLLNSDVECTDLSTFDDLISYLKNHPKVGAITPRIEFSTGELDPSCHRGEPTLWASFTYFFSLEKLFPTSTFFGQYHQGYKDLSRVHEIDACSGAAIIVPQTVIKKVGMLDERFFMYAEDLDWCRRFRDAGYSVIFYPEVRVIHHKYKSGIRNTSKSIARKTRRHFYDTMLQYYDKHHSKNYPQFVRAIIKYFIVLKKGAL